MRNNTVLLVFLSFLFLCSCSTANNNALSKAAPENINYASIADYLRQNSNVSISGQGQRIQLQIRGINSIKGDSRPFIYVDKQPMGREYNRVNSFINANDIKKVEVISSLSQLTIYGEDGNAGVIKIHMKNNISK